MKKFVKDAVCPKCGLREEGSYHKLEYVRWGRNMKLEVSEREYLMRTCAICGHIWREACVEEK